MKKLISLTIITVLAFSLSGCGKTHDSIDVYNRGITTLDNIIIKIKPGYFYDKHEKFIVDENTVGVTVYFAKDGDGDWEVKGGVQE